jgi:hypothetical protein
MSTQFKTHTFHIDLRDLGKFEAKITDETLRKLLYYLHPDYDNLNTKDKARAENKTWHYCARKLRHGYEKRYSKYFCPVSVHRLSTWQNSQYKETSNV